MIEAIIVDDEVKNRQGLAKMLDQFCPDVKLVGLAEGVDKAIKLIKEHDPAIVFLDIEMPEKNGFDLLEHFENPRFEVIFTTAHADYAIKAIKFAALDYLLKPVNINELKVAVEKAIKQIDGRNERGPDERISILRDNRDDKNFNFKRIALPSSNGLEFYKVDGIIRCEADRSYCKFHLASGDKVMVSKPLSEFEELLEECQFFRIHKSNMVNLNHVVRYVKGRGGYVVLTDGNHVDVSARRKEELMRKLGITQ